MGGQAAIRQGDCVEVMRSMDECSVDAIVTDPPYELIQGAVYGFKYTGSGKFSEAREAKRRGFMGKTWDGTGIAFRRETWAEALRVLKSGGYLLAFGGTRTFHRLTVAIEDAGFEIRDCLMWLYGSGFPKSHDVSKAIDKAAGAEREVVGVKPGHENFVGRDSHPLNGGWDRPWASDPEAVARYHAQTAPATDLAKKWQGWGTALKPAWEPIILARKPLIGTVAENVERYGTGALNIDGTRISTTAQERHEMRAMSEGFAGRKWGRPELTNYGYTDSMPTKTVSVPSAAGRWPANVLLDEEAAALLDEETGNVPGQQGRARTDGTPQGNKIYGALRHGTREPEPRGDSGGPSRFFYVAKASKKDRGAGNTHPTVKPTELMRWLVRLVTPPGGLVLDPFAGSGTTAVAAEAEGMRCILIEREPEYVEIAQRRLAA